MASAHSMVTAKPNSEEGPWRMCEGFACRVLPTECLHMQRECHRVSQACSCLLSNTAACQSQQLCFERCWPAMLTDQLCKRKWRQMWRKLKSHLKFKQCSLSQRLRGASSLAALEIYSHMFIRALQRPIKASSLMYDQLLQWWLSVKSDLNSVGKGTNWLFYLTLSISTHNEEGRSLLLKSYKMSLPPG